MAAKIVSVGGVHRGGPQQYADCAPRGSVARLTSFWPSCTFVSMARAIRRTAVTNPSLKAFAKAAESYVEQTFARFPTYGASTGRHEFDAELERPTPALFRAHEKLLRETLTT